MRDILDFLKGVFTVTVERLKIPILNSILISWVIINWKIVLVLLFSENSIERRIYLVSEEYSDPLFVYWLPIIVGLAYVIGLPLIKKMLFHMLVELNKVNWNDHMDYRIGSYKKKIEEEKERNKLQLIKAENKNIDDLRKKNEELEDEKNQLKKTIELLKKELFDQNQLVDERNNAVATIDRLKEMHGVNLSMLNEFLGGGIKYLESIPNGKLFEINGSTEMVVNKFRVLYELKKYGPNRDPKKSLDFIEGKLEKINTLKPRLTRILKDLNLNKSEELEKIHKDEIEVLLDENIVWKIESEETTFYGITDIGLAALDYLVKN